LIIAYNSIKCQQEEDNATEASKPLHLKPNSGGCPGMKVSYPEHSGSSIFQHFSCKISPAVIKFMGIIKQECILFCHLSCSFSQIIFFWLSQNPIKSSKDKVTYHVQLCNLFKEKFGEPF